MRATCDGCRRPFYGALARCGACDRTLRYELRLAGDVTREVAHQLARSVDGMARDAALGLKPRSLRARKRALESGARIVAGGLSRDDALRALSAATDLGVPVRLAVGSREPRRFFRPWRSSALLVVVALVVGLASAGSVLRAFSGIRPAEQDPLDLDATAQPVSTAGFPAYARGGTARVRDDGSGREVNAVVITREHSTGRLLLLAPDSLFASPTPRPPRLTVELRGAPGARFSGELVHHAAGRHLALLAVPASKLRELPDGQHDVSILQLAAPFPRGDYIWDESSPETWGTTQPLYLLTGPDEVAEVAAASRLGKPPEHQQALVLFRAAPSARPGDALMSGDGHVVGLVQLVRDGVGYATPGRELIDSVRAAGLVHKPGARLPFQLGAGTYWSRASSKTVVRSEPKGPRP